MARGRIFTALPLGPAQKRSAQKEMRLLQQIPGQGPRWLGPDAWHVTLNFLGEVEDQLLSDVCQATARACREIPIFDWRIAGLGAFPNLKSPRVLWMGVRDPSGTMSALKERIDQELLPLGFVPEARAFRPHVTIGRVLRQGGLAEEFVAGFQAEMTWEGETHGADTCQVLGSRYPDDAGNYALLATCPLGTTAR